MYYLITLNLNKYIEYRGLSSTIKFKILTTFKLQR